jgi:hypothetical protein
MAVYEAGRWRWAEIPPAQAHEELRPACHRIADHYPAGIVTLKGAMVRQHRDEILGIARNAEAAEKGERPLNRIMSIAEPDPETLVITTTDIHLPRRIGETVDRPLSGELRIHYDAENYFTSFKRFCAARSTTSSRTFAAWGDPIRGRWACRCGSYDVSRALMRIDGFFAIKAAR